MFCFTFPNREKLYQVLLQSMDVWAKNLIHNISQKIEILKTSFSIKKLSVKNSWLTELDLFSVPNTELFENVINIQNCYPKACYKAKNRLNYSTEKVVRLVMSTESIEQEGIRYWKVTFTSPLSLLFSRLKNLNTS